MRLIDRLFGWMEIRAERDEAKKLTDRLLVENLPAEIFTEGEKTVVRIGRVAGRRLIRALEAEDVTVEAGWLRGAPAVFSALVRRPGIVAGVLMTVVLFLFARGRVWEVKITGDGSVDEDVIREIVGEAGLRPGMKISDLSEDGVASGCLLRRDVFSGMNISVSGVVAEVSWFGRKQSEPGSVNSDGEGVNLVALCDGVIVSVLPSRGTAVVVPGQTVHRGDLLISGMSKGGAVRAEGTVIARVTGDYSVSVPLSETKREVTKRRPVSITLRMFGERLFSFGEGGDSVVEKELTLPFGVVLPFSFRVGYAHTVREETVVLSEAEAARIAHRRLSWMIREALSEGELLKQEVAGGYTDGAYLAKAKAEYLINIVKPLAFTARNEYNK